MQGDDDETIRIAPPAREVIPPGPPSRKRNSTPVLLLLFVLAVGGGAAWWLWPPPSPPDTSPAVAVPAPAPEAPAPAPALGPSLAGRLDALPPLLTEQAIEAHRAEAPAMLRLASNTAVFILDFPNLEAQGAALNRVAALVEKTGLPRDRVLNEAEMAGAITRAGDSAATFYYGHNYRGADLARFFRLVREAGLALRPEEEWIAARLAEARALVPTGQEIVLLSIAAPDARLEASWRATILRHELGHGLYGTTPAYAAAVREAWRQGFTEAERAAFRAFLGREGYDTAIEELMIDETQAYLLHTPDQRFFAAQFVGMSEAEVARLRAMLSAATAAVTR